MKLLKCVKMKNASRAMRLDLRLLCGRAGRFVSHLNLLSLLQNKNDENAFIFLCLFQIFLERKVSID